MAGNSSISLGQKQAEDWINEEVNDKKRGSWLCLGEYISPINQISIEQNVVIDYWNHAKCYRMMIKLHRLLSPDQSNTQFCEEVIQHSSE